MTTAAKLNLFKTARIASTGDFVALTKFVPASEKYGHAAFYRVTCAQGSTWSMWVHELTDFVL